MLLCRVFLIIFCSLFSWASAIARSHYYNPNIHDSTAESINERAREREIAIRASDRCLSEMQSACFIIIFDASVAYYMMI